MQDKELYLADDLARLPKFVHDSAGLVVDVSTELWTLNDLTDANCVLSWASLSESDPVLVYGAKKYIIELIKTTSPSHAQNSQRSICRCIESLNADSVQPHVLWLAGFLNNLRSQGSDWLFHYVRAWYRWGADNALPGFDDDTLFAISDYRIPGNKKGEAVLSSDPEDGPLDEFEQSALRSALKRDKGPIEERAALWLFLSFGPNASNVSLLREVDFDSKETGNTIITALKELKMPRIKKRLPPRSQFKTRALTDELAIVIEELIEGNRDRKLGAQFERPLFMRNDPNPKWLDSPLNEYAYHFTPQEITKLLQRCVQRLAIKSPRTGQFLRVTARRLRYTFAVKMVRQGTPPAELAELLDHTDLQNVMVYYKNTPEVVQSLDKALALAFAPIVKAFMGQIVSDERPFDDRVTFIDLNEAMDIGKCGANFLCNLAPPLTCYTCDRFLAFSDGPHETVLDALITQRTALIDDGKKYVATQLDDVIMACAEIVRNIQEGRAA